MLENKEILKNYPQKIYEIKIEGVIMDKEHPRLFSIRPNWEENLNELFLLKFHKLLEEIQFANNIYIEKRLEEQERREYLRLKAKYESNGD